MVITGNVLQSAGSTIVLVNYLYDPETNLINSGLAYIGSGNVSPVELRNIVTGESYKVLISEEVEGIVTSAVYDDCDFEVA